MSADIALSPIVKPRVRPARIAELYPISVSQLAKLRMAGNGPAYERLGHRTVVYVLDDVEAWFTSHRKQSTSDLNGGL